jgi:putative glutamine amidotransferase
MQMYSAYFQCGSDPFGLIQDEPITVRHPKDIPDNAKGFLLLHGGEDISPSLYGDPVSTTPYCRASPTPTIRDQIEVDLVKRAQELNLIILGICRGAQLLCALDGGKLVQHIVGHNDHNHMIVNPDNQVKLGKSNTAHHQMMLPKKSRMTRILGVVNEPILGYSEINTLREYPNIPEIVEFKRLNAFGVQFHPEWMTTTDPIVQWCKNYIQSTFLKD